MRIKAADLSEGMYILNAGEITKVEVLASMVRCKFTTKRGEGEIAYPLEHRVLVIK